MRNPQSLLIVGLAATWLVTGARAVSPEDASRLKTDLTPFGGERAGNAEGTIPEWTGGFTTVPAAYKSGNPRPDFFADEKPLFSISKA